MALEIDTTEIDGIAILTLEGRLAFGQESQSLNQAIATLVGKDQLKIVINLNKLTFIDSCGVGELIAAYSKLSKQGGSLKLASPQDQVQDIFRIVRLPVVLEVYDTQEAALASFA